MDLDLFTQMLPSTNNTRLATSSCELCGKTLDVLEDEDHDCYDHAPQGWKHRKWYPRIG